jgi:hypothetical protein
MRGMTVSKPHTPLPLNMTRRPTNVPGTPTLGQYRHKSAGSALSPARPTPLTIYQDCGVYVIVWFLERKLLGETESRVA